MEFNQPFESQSDGGGGDPLSNAAKRKRHKAGEIIEEADITADRKGKSPYKADPKKGVAPVRKSNSTFNPKGWFQNGNIFGQSTVMTVDGDNDNSN